MKTHSSFRLCAAAVAVPFALLADIVDPADYAASFDIKFAGYAGTTELTDFPALIRLSAARNAFDYSKCAADGSDLRFADSDGNLIPHEIDTWNPNGESTVWVKVPTLAHTTVIRAFYGYRGASQPPAVTSTDVWTNGYVGVWHMSAAEGTFTQTDSTTTGKNLAANNNNLTGMQCGVSGAVGAAAELGRNGVTSGGFSVSDTEGVLDGFSALTLEAWTYQTAYPTDNHRYLFNKMNAGGNKAAYYFEQLKNTSGKLAAYVKRTLNGSEGDTGVWQGSTYSGAALNEWTHQVYRWHGDTGRSDGFLNAINVVTDAAAAQKKGTIVQVSGSLYVGNQNLSNNRVFPGKIDEVRISNVARSDDWIVATHDTVASDGFAVSEVPNDWSKYAHKFSIAFPGVEEGATLENFPVLVKVSEAGISGFHYTDCAKPDGGDLRFSDANGTLLPCEVEDWNTNGVSLIWVKVPSLAKGTRITCYYGWNLAPAVDSTEVWDANYLAVWHMDAEAGNLNQMDATANGKTVTGSSSTDVQSGVEGKVGLAARTGLASTGGYEIADSGHFNGLSEITLEAWTFREEGAEKPASARSIVEMARYTGTWAYGWRLWEVANSEKSSFFVQIGTAAQTGWATSPGDAPAQGEWHYHARRWAGANGYHSETLDANTATTASANNFKGTMETFSNGTLCIGNRAASQSNPFPGCIDEVRISNVVRSDAWVKATHDTIAENATFTRYGAVGDNVRSTVVIFR
jgi:hypothetical protein